MNHPGPQPNYANRPAGRLAFPTLIAGLLLVGLSSAHGTGVTELYGLTGTYATTLVQGADGNFYGTTPVGGLYNFGTIFEWSQAGGFTTLASFNGPNGDGPNGLTLAGDGNLYGTTYSGGSGNYGTIFQFKTDGTLTTLHSFQSQTLSSSNGYWAGIYPNSTLTLDTNGVLYGTTLATGGSSADGSIFELTPSGSITTAALFNNAAVIVFASSPPVRGIDGDLYSLTDASGPGYSFFYEFADNGVPHFLNTSLASLRTPAPGLNPQGALIRAADGSFYGTAYAGGADGYGTVFDITTNGTMSALASFDGTDGAGPQSGLILASDGNYYGTASLGGDDGFGTVFMFATNGVLTSLGSFNGVNGAFPSAAPFQSGGGLYGVTPAGGANGTGTIYQLLPGGAPTTLASFPGFNGAVGWSGLITGADGNFYGTTYAGGAYEYGTIFRLSTNGAISALYSFGASEDTNGVPLDGGCPEGGLVQDADGAFYGTTSMGGANNSGTVFKLAPNGTLNTLASFNGANGSDPQSELAFGTDGSLYGTTTGGGASGQGTVFSVTTNGALTSLFSFPTPGSGLVGTNGFWPTAGLTLGPDGNFYGSTMSTLFRITPDGTLTTLLVFPTYKATNGVSVMSSLTLAADGNFYGTTAAGGVSNAGVVFRLATDGTYTPIASFVRTNGSTPYGRLIQGPDGELYGTTHGGSTNYGTVFRVSTNGTLATLVTFDYTNGGNPVGGLTLGSDGSLYGATTIGGSGTRGNLFRVTLRTFLRVVAQVNGSLTMSWDTIPGLTYQVQSAPDLNPADWSNLGPPITAAIGTQQASDAFIASQNRFYRVILLP